MLYAKEYAALNLRNIKIIIFHASKEVINMLWFKLLLSLVIILGAFYFGRIYFFTKMKSFFLFFLGAVIASIGLFGFAFNYWKEETGWKILPYIFIILGGLILAIGFAILATLESGMNRELIKRTTFLQCLVGDIPIIDKDKYPPLLKKRTGIIFGILFLLVGISLGLFYKEWLLMPILMISQGIFLIIFSLIYCR